MMVFIQNSSIYTDQCWPTAFSLLQSLTRHL